MRKDEFDWEGIEAYFVERTPASLSLRQLAEMTPGLAETNHTFINYQLLKDESKARGWIAKRAKFLIEKFPSLYTDAENIYYILRDKLVDGHATLSGSELTQLSREMREYMSVLRDREAVFEDGVDEERVTRDDFVQLIHREAGKPSQDGFADRAISVIKEEDAQPDD